MSYILDISNNMLSVPKVERQNCIINDSIEFISRARYYEFINNPLNYSNHSNNESNREEEHSNREDESNREEEHSNREEETNSINVYNSNEIDNIIRINQIKELERVRDKLNFEVNMLKREKFIKKIQIINLKNKIIKNQKKNSILSYELNWLYNWIKMIIPNSKFLELRKERETRNLTIIKKYLQI